jgi:uncharacterized protein YciI
MLPDHRFRVQPSTTFSALPTLQRVEYFFYCRDRPGTAALRDELVEAHWSFMDRYADTMIARGPTLTPDGTAATGSMHIVDLPDARAAHVFAFEEPNYRAGVYGEVLVRRWSNALGGTMWDFQGDPARNGRFLIIGHGAAGTAPDGALDDDQRRFVTERRRHFIACGPLLSDDGTNWVGSAMLVELLDRAAVEAMLAQAPHTQAGMYAGVEIHHWQFGGRPSE